MLGQKQADARSSPVGVPVTTTEGGVPYLWRTANGRYLKVSVAAHFLLTQAEAGRTPLEIAERLSRPPGRIVTAAEAEAALRRVQTWIADVEQQPGTARLLGLWWRARILPRSATAAVARALSYAFHPWVAAVLGAAFGYVAIRDHRILQEVSPAAAMSQPALFWPIYGLIVLSMIVHEFGHVSAAVRFGAHADDIGIGLYWIYPVCYSNVSAVWALKQRQRVVVDVAGFYFQFLVAGAYLEVYHLTGWEPARYAPLGILVTSAFMLIPVFKLDGYWLLSDALGVPNLARQMRRVLSNIGRRLRRRPAESFPWPRPVAALIAVYGALSILLVTVALAWMISQVGHGIVTYPVRMAGLVRDLALPPHHLAVGRLQSVFFATYLYFGLGIGLLGAALRTTRRVRRRRAEPTDIPGTSP